MFIHAQRGLRLLGLFVGRCNRSGGSVIRMIRQPRRGQGEFITAGRRLLFTRRMLRGVVGTVICVNVCSDHSVQAVYQLSSMYEG